MICLLVHEFKERLGHNYLKRRINMFEEIIGTLHKYNMLFESQPQGYSNVVMTEVQDLDTSLPKDETDKQNGYDEIGEG